MRVITVVRDFIPLATSWPVIVLILALWFQRQIKDLIASVYEAKIGSSVFVKFWQFRGDARGPDARAIETLPTKQISAPSSVKLENVANAFWLGNDLDWTAQTALRGAPKERIVHGLKQCYHHISELGLVESAPAKQLSSLKSEVEILPESALDRQWRNTFAEKIYVVIRTISDVLIGHQPGFRHGPEL